MKIKLNFVGFCSHLDGMERETMEKKIPKTDTDQSVSLPMFSLCCGYILMQASGLPVRSETQPRWFPSRFQLWLCFPSAAVKKEKVGG